MTVEKLVVHYSSLPGEHYAFSLSAPKGKKKQNILATVRKKQHFSAPEWQLQIPELKEARKDEVLNERRWEELQEVFTHLLGPSSHIPSQHARCLPPSIPAGIW